MRGQCKKCGHDGCCCDTPTPWTDANEEDGWNPCGWAVASDLVRELERELTAVTEQRDRLAEALKGIAGMPKYDQDDPYRLRNKAAKAFQSLFCDALQSLTPEDRHGAERHCSAPTCFPFLFT